MALQALDASNVSRYTKYMDTTEREKIEIELDYLKRRIAAIPRMRNGRPKTHWRNEYTIRRMRQDELQRLLKEYSNG